MVSINDTQSQQMAMFYNLLDETPMETPDSPNEGAASYDQRWLNKIELDRGNYDEYWDDWINDKGCFLTSVEIQVLEFFHSRFAKRDIQIELPVSVRTGLRMLVSILNKLDKKYPLFWEYKFQRARELPSEVPPNTYKYRFLHKPIREIEMGNRLRLLLASEKIETMYDLVIGYSGKDLLNIKGFGKMCLYELQSILRDNDCQYMLKEIDENT